MKPETVVLLPVENRKSEKTGSPQNLNSLLHHFLMFTKIIESSENKSDILLYSTFVHNSLFQFKKEAVNCHSGYHSNIDYNYSDLILYLFVRSFEFK